MCWRLPIRWVFFLTQPVGGIEGVWSLLCDILQISAQLKHLFTFGDSMGWLPFCLFTVKKWCFMELHVAPEVRWIETHFCCSLSCWQMTFPSHPPAFPSCHLSFWRGHWFPRVLRFFYRRDVSPALSLCTCSASGRRVSCMVISQRLPTLDVSLPISVHLPVARQGHSLTTIKLYFCTHKGMSSESHMQQVLCSNESKFENLVQIIPVFVRGPSVVRFSSDCLLCKTQWRLCHSLGLNFS